MGIRERVKLLTLHVLFWFFSVLPKQKDRVAFKRGTMGEDIWGKKYLKSRLLVIGF